MSPHTLVCIRSKNPLSPLHVHVNGNQVVLPTYKIRILHQAQGQMIPSLGNWKGISDYEN